MGNKAIGVLKICAWLNFVAGVTVAVTVWLDAFSSIVPVTNILAGFLYAAGGIIGWAFLYVVCSMAENLNEIRMNTALAQGSHLFDRQPK